MGSGKRGFINKRTIGLSVGFALLFAAIAGKLVFIQLCRADQFAKWAEFIRLRRMPIPASRGSIYDRTGRPLALSIETASIYANRREIKDLALTARQVASTIGGDPKTYRQKIEQSKTIAWLVKNVDPRLGDPINRGYRVVEHGKVRFVRIDGVGVQRDTKRVYPAGAAAAHILGFTNFYGTGLEGAEFVMQDVLRGRDGVLLAELDARRRIIAETKKIIREPRSGRDVYLTIDLTIQHIAEQALARVAHTYHPQSACAIVLGANGDVLALANYPTFDPNNALEVPASKWRNRAVADLYEPGSTLKAVTVAAGLNEGISPNAIMARCTGHERLKGGGLPCSLHHPFEAGHGCVNMPKIIRHSCNIGAAHIAMRLGPEKLRGYEKAFGLLDRTEAGFGCEAVGRLAPADRWPLIQLADIGFGQGIAVTPLQMACVYATVANGGVYVQPRVVREVRNPDGGVCRPLRLTPPRRVVSKQAASLLTRMLVRCVEEGTGKNARIKGRTIAGKTGSAQIPNPNGRGYLSGAFVASFMGFAPANKPRLVIAVVVNRPQGSHYGATVAAPVFREIAEKALWYYKVPSDAPAKPDIRRNQDADRKRLV